MSGVCVCVFPGGGCSVHQCGELQWSRWTPWSRPLPGTQWVMWWEHSSFSRSCYSVYQMLAYKAVHTFSWSCAASYCVLCPVVFMGSEKYPAENGFDAFLKKHGGSDNASTDCERTIFQFDVQRKYFREALDRWVVRGSFFRVWSQNGPGTVCVCLQMGSVLHLSPDDRRRHRQRGGGGGQRWVSAHIYLGFLSSCHLCYVKLNLLNLINDFLSFSVLRVRNALCNSVMAVFTLLLCWLLIQLLFSLNTMNIQTFSPQMWKICGMCMLVLKSVNLISAHPQCFAHKDMLDWLKHIRCFSVKMFSFTSLLKFQFLTSGWGRGLGFKKVFYQSSVS